MGYVPPSILRPQSQQKSVWHFGHVMWLQLEQDRDHKIDESEPATAKDYRYSGMHRGLTRHPFRLAAYNSGMAEHIQI